MVALRLRRNGHPRAEGAAKGPRRLRRLSWAHPRNRRGSRNRVRAARWLAPALSDAGVYEFRRELTYICQWYGCELVVADRW